MYNLFYEEPLHDRWFKYDRYPRKLVRRIIRGPEPIGGVKRWFINLCAGLDILGVSYSINNYKTLKKKPGSWALVIGKSNVIEKIPKDTHIIYGPGVSAHPYENDFWHDKLNIKTIIVSCDWFKDMYDQALPVPIPTVVWPSGIDTEGWDEIENKPFKNTVLIYDKIRWDREKYSFLLLDPIKEKLASEGINVKYIKYGDYKEEDFRQLLRSIDGMIFLCEHETQGFAYLQTLSSGVPILAWDRGGYWQDPSMYPHLVNFQPVTSVPYWDKCCGEKFEDFESFYPSFEIYWKNIIQNKYNPRKYILQKFRLEDCAKRYLTLVNKIMSNEIPVHL